MKTKRSDPMLSMHCWAYDQDPSEDIGIDEDGHVTGACLTYEPYGTSIEVLIELDTPPAEAAKILRKAADWVEELMAPASLKEMKKHLDDFERRERERQNREAVLDV